MSGPFVTMHVKSVVRAFSKEIALSEKFNASEKRVLTLERHQRDK